MAFLLLLAAVLVQSAILGRVSGFWLQPDLPTLLTLSWASLRGPAAGLRWSLLGGLLVDMLGTTPLGFTVLALAPAAYLCGWIREQAPELPLWLALLTVAGGTALFGFAASILLGLLYGPLAGPLSAGPGIATMALANGLGAAVALPGLRSLGGALLSPRSSLVG